MGKKGKGPGKKPKGRAAQRGKTQKSSPRSGGLPPSFMRSSHQAFDDDEDDSYRQFRGFQGGTPKGPFPPRNANVKLRHQAISFISAGSNTPAEPDEQRQQGDGERRLPDDLQIHQDDVDVDEGDAQEDEDEDENGLDESGIQTNIMMDTDVELSEQVFGQMNLNPRAEVDGTVEVSDSLYVVDTVGDSSLVGNGTSKGKHRAPSPARSDTSEEVVVFHGRKNQAAPSASGSRQRSPKKASAPQTPQAPQRTPATAANGPQASSKPTTPQPSSTPHVTDDLLEALGETPATSRAFPSFQAKGWAAQPSRQEKQAQASSSDAWHAAPSLPYWRKGKPRPDLDPQLSSEAARPDGPSRPANVMFAEPKEQTEEAGAEETISQLQADWKQVLREKRQERAGTDGADDLEVDEVKLDMGKRSRRKGKRGRKKDNRQWRNAINSDDEDDEEAAYDDYMQNLAAQLENGDDELPLFTAINASSGPSLVVDGKEIADDAVLEYVEEDDTSDSEYDGPIGQDAMDYENEQRLNYSDLESSDLEETLEDTEREQWEDEEDLRQRRIDAMTDEKIARLFAKQQELGIDAEEIVIDDGSYDDDVDMDGIGDVDEARAGLQNITNSAFGRSNKAGSQRRRGNDQFLFPDASALADTVEQYGENGFDIMDFDRPSLRPTKKGRKGKLPPEVDALSDEDLKEELHGAWENDRAKKRIKKAERYELRSQGLLGASGKKGKADLGVKYREGMTMAQVMEELKTFLQDEGQQSRPFPPMDKRDRRALHEVANALNLKSKSVGKGNQRFPVLYKTSFTLDYDEAVSRKVQYASSQGFLHNAARKGFGAKGKNGGGAVRRTPGRGGGSDKAATGLRNGQVVGADAAAIGAESFGHRLMEKMGWQRGTALGKDGEGLLVPVEQVMRSGKAGLG